MKIFHLSHDCEGIRCKNCGARFEVARRQLSNPESLIEAKERIASKHVCGSARRIVEAPRVRDLDRWWTQEVRRLQAQMAIV